MNIFLTLKEVTLENNRVLGGYLFIAADDFLDNILWASVTVFIPRASEYFRYDSNRVSSD